MTKYNLKYTLLIAFILCSLSLSAQSTITDTGTLKTTTVTPEKPSWFTLDLSAGYFVNYGDLALRYPEYTCFPLGVGYQHKNKWVASLDYNLIFGTSVDIAGYFDHISNENGYMIDAKGQPAIINTYMRGFSARAHYSKIIPLSKNPNFSDWNIQLGGGLGYSQTYILFQFDEGELPQLEGLNTGGYDRLSGGFQIAERFRIQYLNPNSLSFFLGVDLIQGSTKSLRPWNFSTNTADDQSMTEIAAGVNLGLVIPIKTRSRNTVPDYFME
jgi:hypothetical protein